MGLERFRVFVVICVVVFLGQFGALGAQTQLVFERGLNGFEGLADTSIFFDLGNASVDNAGGGIEGVFTGKTAQLGLRRALVRVDLSSIPKGSRVIGATLELTVERSAGNSGDADHGLYPLLKDWGEGIAAVAGAGGFGATAAEGDATWNANHFGVSTWSTPGGDFATTASAVAPAGQAGETAHWSGAGLVADVQGWVDAPESNFGWIIIGDEGTAQRAKRFYSSEAATHRPRLTVVLGNAATPADINADGAVNAVDVQLVINAALGLDIGGLSGDVTGDTVVNAVDVQTVINAALGLKRASSGTSAGRSTLNVD